MKTIEAYVSAVGKRLPRWMHLRAEHLEDLRFHLMDRVASGEPEEVVLAGMDEPAKYAAALVADVPLVPAPLGRRLGAFAIDVLLGIPLAFAQVMVMLMVMEFFVAGWPEGMWRTWWGFFGDALQLSAFVAVGAALGLMAGSVLVLSVLYFPAAEAIWGTTIGKHVLGLGVVAEDGTRVGWGKAIARRLPFFFEFFWLDAIFAFFGARRQRAFDRVAGTLVIRYPAETELPRGHGAVVAPPAGHGFIPG